jgi:ABC-type uncharacterized transport system ATPase subunit
MSDSAQTISEPAAAGQGIPAAARGQWSSINVAPGEIVGLLGPNGAGKTTTFNMVVGVVKPDEGR